jgi:hypothetical protein
MNVIICNFCDSGEEEKNFIKNETFPIPLYNISSSKLYSFQFQAIVVDEQKELKENKLAAAASSAITAAAALGIIYMYFFFMKYRLFICINI